MKTKIAVKNIKCDGCVNAIKTGLKKFPEINEISVDIPSGIVEVTFDEKLSLDKIKEALAQLGYPEKKI